MVTTEGGARVGVAVLVGSGGSDVRIRDITDVAGFSPHGVPPERAEKAYVRPEVLSATLGHARLLAPHRNLYPEETWSREPEVEIILGVDAKVVRS